MSLAEPVPDPVEALLDPVRPLVEAAARALHPRGVEALAELEPGFPALLADLLVDPLADPPQDGVHGPEDLAFARTWPDLAPLALDRWRRAAGRVLEALALRAFEESLGLRLPRAWWSLGAAAEAVDRAAPALGWLLPEAALLLRAPERGLVSRPRAAGWLWRWARHGGRGWEPGTRPDLDEEDWAAFGVWLLDPAQGPLAVLPVTLLDDPPVGEPTPSLPELSFARLRAKAGPAGLWLRWRGGQRGLCAGQAAELRPGRLYAGSLGLHRERVLPEGPWRLAGGDWGDRPGAARGIELRFVEDGRVELVFADAFAGPGSGMLVELAGRFGLSGTGQGRYRVVEARGPRRGRLVFEELRADLLSVHPRFSGRFSLPAETFLGPLRQALAAIAASPWDFEPDGDELLLRARIGGTPALLRLGPAMGSDG